MEETTLEAIQLFVALITAAALVGLLVRRVAIPYTVALVVLGLIVGALVPGLEVQVTPELLLAVLLPGLLFEAAYHIRWLELRRAFGGVALLAVPGVLIVAAIVAAVLLVTTGLPFELGFVVGAMVAATDPVAVISTFKRLGSPRRLRTLLEAESLFNDGTSLVVFTIALAVLSTNVSAAEAVGAFAVTMVISTAIGLTVGFAASRVIATVDDHLIELTISLAMAYGTYLLADRFGHSGIIATVVAGLVLGNYGRRVGMSQRTVEALDLVWGFIAFLLNAVVFLLIGLAITLPGLLGSLVPIAWGVLAVLLARALVVYGLLGGVSWLLTTPRSPAPRHTRTPPPTHTPTPPATAVSRGLTGHRVGIPLAWLHVMFWSGLRGAVTVALALSLPADIPQRDLLQQITYGVVLFTLLVQGTTVDFLIDRSGAGGERPPTRLGERPPVRPGGRPPDDQRPAAA